MMCRRAKVSSSTPRVSTYVRAHYRQLLITSVCLGNSLILTFVCGYSGYVTDVAVGHHTADSMLVIGAYLM